MSEVDKRLEAVARAICEVTLATWPDDQPRPTWRYLIPEARAALAAADAVEAGDGWRPIETASRVDGRKIEIPYDRPRIVKFVCAERAADEFGGSADDYEAGWSEDDELVYPKLWRPAPSPEDRS